MINLELIDLHIILRGGIGMLKSIIENGYGKDRDLNCAETILYGANEAYNLGLDESGLKLAAAFGGGMAIESVCGSLTAGTMVLSSLFVKNYGREDSKIKDITKEFLKNFQDEMGNINCVNLKEKYRTEELKCHNIIVKAAEILDVLIKKELIDKA